MWTRTFFVLAFFAHCDPAAASNEAKRLFEDLFSGYNKMVRPVVDNSQLLEVKFKLRLSQLLDVEWIDYKLTWSPQDYGNITVLYVPGQLIWLPDLVLYNNADGNYQVTIITKATIHYTGKVQWEPPAIYKSMCQINVEWFPFDEQTCEMKFGSWTYDGFQVDLLHMSGEADIVRYGNDHLYVECLENAIDLSDYYRSTEWDIIAVPGRKKKETYPCCLTPYTDITYEIHLRRKTLFYTVNLIFPCIGISFLTVLVFHLPSDSGEKVTLSISILISLIVFFLLLVEIIPSTSLVIPLIGKYLLFTMIMVTLSICVTVVVINVHFRSTCTHTMSPLLRRVFIESSLPFYLWLSPRPLISEKSILINQRLNREESILINQPLDNEESILINQRLNNEESIVINRYADQSIHADTRCPEKTTSMALIDLDQPPIISNDQMHSNDQDGFPLEIRKTIRKVQYISQHFQHQALTLKVTDEWRFVAMVIDRIFLVLFSVACMIGTTCIILQAPAIYDVRPAIDHNDQRYSTNGIFCGRK